MFDIQFYCSDNVYMSYIIDTSANGAQLEDLNAITYTSINAQYSSSNIIPTLGTTYQLKNNRNQVVSNNLVPYISPQGLSLPGLMACDQLNNIYIANANGSICKIVNNTLQEIATTPRVFPNIPRGLVFDASGILYVSAEEYISTDISGVSGFYLSQIYKIDQNGNLTLFNISGVTLNKIRGVAFNNVGNLFIVDQGNNCVIKVVIQDYNNGIGTIVVPYYIGFNGPTDITFDSFNNMFVANTNDGNIIQVSSSGSITVFASNLYSPCSLRFDMNGILYVTCFCDSTMFDPNTYNGSIQTIVNASVNTLDISGVTLTHPYGITFDNSNNIYVTNTIDGYGLYFYGDNQIYKVFIEYAGAPYYQNLGAGGNNNKLGNITGLAFDKNNNLYTCEYYPPVSGDFPYDSYPPYNPISYNGVVYKVLENNISNLYYSNNGANFTPLQNPKGIIFDADDNAYVINVSANQIVKIAPGGGDNSGIILDITGASLDNPSDLSFDSNYNLFVSDYLSSNIVVVNIVTLVATVLPYTGVAIVSPTGISIDFYTNNIYICNSGTNNILLLTNSGSGYVSSVYNNTSVTTIINNPLAILYEYLQGITYFSNANDNSIGMITNNGFVSKMNIIFDTSYSLLTNSSSCITFDTLNNLYISNQSNISFIGDINPIIKVTLNYSGIQIYNSTTSSLNGASYANVDESGNLYVYSINDNINNIKVITPENSSSVYASYVGFPSSIIGMYFDNYQILYILSNRLDNSFYQINAGNYVVALGLQANPPLVQTFTDFKFDSSSGVLNNIYIANANSNQFGETSPIYGNILTSSLGPQPNPSVTNFTLSVFENNLNSITLDAASNPVNAEFNPAYIVFDNMENMYVVNFLSIYNTLTSPNIIMNNYVYRLNMSDPNGGTIYADIPQITSEPNICYPTGMTIDSNGYLYISVENTFGYDENFPNNQQISAIQNIIYITNNPITNNYSTNTLTAFYTYPTQSYSLYFILFTIQYDSYENSLVVVYSNNMIDKLYLSFAFTGIKLGKYNDTLTINNVFNSSVNPITTFYVYNPYVVVDPSNIPVNTATDVNVHFVIPLILPNPTHSYQLTYYNTNAVVSNTMKNNATIVNPRQIIGSTYPTGISNDSLGNLYIALQNNTISFVDICGNYYSNFVPESYGLLGPSNLCIDASNIIYVLNLKSTFISKVQSNAQVVNVNNNFYTGISNPIALTFDYISNDALYLLTGSTPNFQVTYIPIADPSNSYVIPLQLGSLYNPKGLVIDQFDVTGPKYLYVSEVNSSGQNTILRINLTAGPSPVYYQIQTFVTGLTYSPYSMTTKSDGYLYVNDTKANAISKISVTDPYGSSIQDWIITCIYVPIASTFNIDGNLYVANSGTNPNNNKVTKIYVDYFEFQVSLNNYGTNQLSLFDVSTGTYVANGNFSITTY